VDALADLLAGARARGAVFCQTVLDPPWSLRVCDDAPLALVATVRGDAWMVFDDAEDVHLHPGDVAMVRGPAPYTVADDPATPPQLVALPGGRCSSVDGADSTEELGLAPRTWGRNPAGSTVLISGTYSLRGEVSDRLLNALPRVLVVPHGDSARPLMGLVVSEIASEQPGQQLVLDRLLDLALVDTLRAWFARPEAQAPAWYQAQSDPVVGQALRLMHGAPADPWTVAQLASRVGVSRAAFARRFNTLVGEPPMAYLAQWRITLAADLLRETDATTDSIARQVGYADAFGFSVAFKRLRGVTPTAHRSLSA
jgi:AraC-like DNA-binding protein